MQILAERLRALRKKYHLSQAATAKQVKVSFPTYCRYEHDEREPSATTLVLLADLFSVSTDYLLGRAEKPNTRKVNTSSHSEDSFPKWSNSNIEEAQIVATFAENLLSLRKKSRWSQQLAAEQIGIPVSTYRRYETGKREPTLTTLVKIADCYHLTLDELISHTSQE